MKEPDQHSKQAEQQAPFVFSFVKVYDALLGIDGIWTPGQTAGFRVRQALWDLADDVEDIEQDRKSIGANVLLLSTRGKKTNLRRLAHSLLVQALHMDMQVVLKKAIEKQYEETLVSLN